LEQVKIVFNLQKEFRLNKIKEFDFNQKKAWLVFESFSCFMKDFFSSNGFH
jgi:hypothetical protein